MGKQSYFKNFSARTVMEVAPERYGKINSWMRTDRAGVICLKYLVNLSKGRRNLPKHHRSH
jgi:hypothetical protein